MHRVCLGLAFAVAFGGGAPLRAEGPTKQDRQGFLWLGYEGHFAGAARSLFLDSEFNIWVGMRSGWSRARLSRTPIDTSIPLKSLTNESAAQPSHQLRFRLYD
jgi:hypothetical protein